MQKRAISAMSTLGGGERKANKALVVSPCTRQTRGFCTAPAPRGPHSPWRLGPSSPGPASQPRQLLLLQESFPAITKPQPLTEPPKLSHSFCPDPAPTPNPGWWHSRAGHQVHVREEPRDSRNLQLLREQLPVSLRGCHLHRRLRDSAGSEPSFLGSSSYTGPSHCGGHEPFRPSQATARGPLRWHLTCHSS